MLFYGREDFAPGAGEGDVSGAQVQQNFVSILSRERAKDLAHDYLDREISERRSREHPESGAEKLSVQAIQQRAREKWLEFRAGHARATDAERTQASDHSVDKSTDADRTFGRRSDNDYGF